MNPVFLPARFVIFPFTVLKTTTIMKWENVLSNEQQEVFELCEDGKKLLTLEFHPFTNSARIKYADEKRVFQIRKEGFLRNKTVVRDEYGMRIGQVGSHRSGASGGTLELNDEKFFYTTTLHPASQLVLYKESPDKPFVACSMEPGNGKTSIAFNRNNKAATSAQFLVMALCWYMFLPVAKETGQLV